MKIKVLPAIERAGALLVWKALGLDKAFAQAERVEEAMQGLTPEERERSIELSRRTGLDIEEAIVQVIIERR